MSDQTQNTSSQNVNTILPRAPGSSELSEHREFIQTIGRIVSGRKEINEDENRYYVFEIPPHTALEGIEELRECDFGYLEWDDNRYYVDDKTVVEMGDRMHKLHVLSTIRGLVSEQKRELALEANKQHDGRYVKPKGKHGHMLSIYDGLLDQIDEVKFRLQRELKKMGP